MVFFCFMHGVAQGNSSMFHVELVHRPLSVGFIPYQGGQANSPFLFNFARYVQQKPEIAYQITNTQSTAIKALQLKTPIPPGLTLLDYDYADCARIFMLYPNQSCFIRFDLDSPAYRPTSGGDPLVCAEQGECVSPPVEQQLNSAVADAEPTQLLVTPSEQAGLSFDPDTFSLRGTPNSTGTYIFEVRAYNKHVTSAPAYLTINLSSDPKDKPIFKKDVMIPSAAPNEEYRLNLMDLLEQNPTFMTSNQVQFQISKNHEYPSWLDIDEADSVLHGHVPAELAGKKVRLWLIASSNTGGSTYYELLIPVVFDPTQKPMIKEGIEYSAEVAEWFRRDLRGYITDPTHSSDLEIIIDSTHPEAPWLTAYGTEIKGSVPYEPEVLGTTYEVRLHAHTNAGGDSAQATLLISVGINKNLTPRFTRNKSICPNFYSGQSYLCDFVANNSVVPTDIPYTVEFAAGFPVPHWLRLEDNKLIAERVSDEKRFTDVYFVLKNIPGGASDVINYLIYVQDGGIHLLPKRTH